jgi:predicted Rossmann fold nucleotide-binding protein DprA/Smf involved in DNA uptake
LVAIRGNAAVLALPPVAIVGSRNALAAGVKITERRTRGLCEVGFGLFALRQDSSSACGRAARPALH